MKKRILAFLAVLAAALLLSACEKAPAEAESGAAAAEQGGEPDESGCDTDRLNELIRMAFSVTGIQVGGSADCCFASPDDIKPEGFFNCFYSFADEEKFYDEASEKYIFTTDDIQSFINENFYNAEFAPERVESAWDIYKPESDGHTYAKSGFCGLDGLKQNFTVFGIAADGDKIEVTFCLNELENPTLPTQEQYLLTVYKSGGSYLIYSLTTEMEK